MEIKIYKIYDTERQLFFKGGWSNFDHNYGKQGKTWNNMGHVKNCLRGFIDESFIRDEKGKIITDDLLYGIKGWKNNIPDTWEVIEFSSVTGERRFKAKDLYPPTNE